jgi:hypothetical protein
MPFGEEFRKAYGRGELYRAFQAADRARLAAIVPGYLLDLWESDGLAGYRGGLLWMHDPHELEAVIAAWKLPKPVVPVARTAFGRLFVISDAVAQNGSTVQQMVRIDPHTATYATVGAFAEKFLTKNLAKEDYLQNALMEPETKRAAADVGPLDWNEMYAYEPALALGGSGKRETIRKVNLFNHHHLLAQLGPIKQQLM